MKSLAEINGPAGSAWKTGFDPSEHRGPGHSGQVVGWVINAPGQSPAWHQYLLSAVHLRPIENAPPAVIAYPGASHEIILVALVPDAPELTPANFVSSRDQFEGRGWFLTPFNYVHQFGPITDEQCEKLVDLMAWSIVQGHLPAEPLLSGGDYWTKSLEKTLEHITTEGHAPKVDTFGTGKSRLLS